MNTKTLLLSLFLTTSTFSAFSQQFLWSTIKDSSFKYVPFKEVTDEVMEFYDFYRFYLDGAGYSKEGFFKTLENSQSFKGMKGSSWEAFKKAIKNINEPSVFAIRTNPGNGSMVTVFCVSNENVNVIMFTNSYEAEANSTGSYYRQKFEKWLNTLLN